MNLRLHPTPPLTLCLTLLLLSCAKPASIPTTILTQAKQSLSVWVETNFEK